MLLELETTRAPTSDLSWLLHKHPDKHQTFALSFGQAHVFYPVSDESRCVAALWVEIDPIDLSRGREGVDETMPLRPYVNDRPYAASSYLSVALTQVFGTAMAGKCDKRPEALAPLPLKATLHALPCRGGEKLVRALFEPLGYEVTFEGTALDEHFPSWGAAPYAKVSLSATTTLAALLEHVYVMVPVLDDDKHYWVGDDEVDKLVRRGESWLPSHPLRELITRRYLKHQRSLTKNALARLSDEGEEAQTDGTAQYEREQQLEAKLSLEERRRAAVIEALVEHGAQTVVDLGCGEGKLVRDLCKDERFTRVTAMDVSANTLVIANERLERLSERQRAKATLLHGSLAYRDARLSGHDAAACVEVIEHVEPSRLEALEDAIFAGAAPRVALITTPNREYNARFEKMAPGAMRHPDHRFEWSREEFRAWCDGVCARRGYTVSVRGVGEEDPALGAPTQMAVFVR